MASSKNRKNASAPRVRRGPSPDDVHDIVYFKRHVKDDISRVEPGGDALRSWPASVRAKAAAILIAVATAPPNRTTLGDADYAAVRVLGQEYLSRNPRSIG